MGNAVLAAKHSTGSVTRAVARRVGPRRIFRIQHQAERATQAAAKLSVAAGARAKFMVTEMQGKPHLGDFDAAELDAADAVPFADRRPAVAAGRSAAAGAGLKQVPDKISSRTRIFSLDRDPEAAAPTRHGAVRT